MTWKLRSTVTRKITKKLAEQICNMPRIDGERSLSGSRLHFLMSQIESAKIVAFRWVTAILTDGREFRVNGQHTSHLFANGLPIPPGATVILERYDADSVEDIADLWARFDPTASGRTKRYLLRAHLRAHSLFQTLPLRPAGTVVSAIAAETYGPRALNKTANADKIRLIDGEADFAVWACDLLSAVAGRFLDRIGIVWTMYRTWKMDPQDAAVFWSECVTGANPNPESPTRQLQRILLTSHSDNGLGARMGGKKFDMQTFAYITAEAWNAWRRGDDRWKPKTPRRPIGPRPSMI